jgi:hypothetical protein
MISLFINGITKIALDKLGKHEEAKICYERAKQLG